VIVNGMIVGAILYWGLWLYRRGNRIADARTVAYSLVGLSAGSVQIVNLTRAHVEVKPDGAGVRIVIG
jgi:hypothetical protein